MRSMWRAVQHRLYCVAWHLVKLLRTDHRHGVHCAVAVNNGHGMQFVRVHHMQANTQQKLLMMACMVIMRLVLCTLPHLP